MGRRGAEWYQRSDFNEEVCTTRSGQGQVLTAGSGPRSGLLAGLLLQAASSVAASGGSPAAGRRAAMMLPHPLPITSEPE